MQDAIREYDARLDAKRGITLRSVHFEHHHVSEMEDGTIILEPRELTAPHQISVKTLSMMDASIRNMKSEKVSEAIDLSESED